MKHYLFLLSACALMCCSQPEPVAEKPTETPKISRFSMIGPLFENLVITDTLFVSAGEAGNNGYRFDGQPMDSMQVMALSYYYDLTYQDFRQFRACYKFPFDDSHTGLIVNSPGENGFISLDLLVFDVKKDSVVRWFTLSDLFGDAGEIRAFNSCLFRDKKQQLKIVTHDYSEYDHSVDTETDTIVEHWNKFYLIDLSDIKGDTLSTDSATITDRYPAIMKRLIDL